VLVTGEIVDFGYQDSGTNDAYDFRFTCTGGDLAPYFAGKDIGMTMGSINSTFSNDFNADFEGWAQGWVTPIRPLGTISGVKWLDITGNGPSSDDTGLGGTTVELYRDADNNGVLTAAGGPAVKTTVSGGDGSYTFASLAAGRYFVSEVVPAGYTRTAPALGICTIDLAAGQVSVGNDFANFQNYSLVVHKFVDINGDGIENGGDGGVAGIHIAVTLDNNGDSIADVTFTGVTDDNGDFAQTDIGPGCVVVTEDFSDSAFSWQNVSSSNTAFAGTSGRAQYTAFGNVVTSAGVAKTLGFWANNADKTLGQILTLNNDLDAGGITSALYNSGAYTSGVNEFISFKAFRSWILGANAKNMAYMLSAQLAAAALNVGSGMASAYTLVKITAAQDVLISSATTLIGGNCVIQIRDVIAEANVALAAPSAYSKEYLDALKTILDNFNNMTNWYSA
jgi:hypothetical protein